MKDINKLIINATLAHFKEYNYTFNIESGEKAIKKSWSWKNFSLFLDNHLKNISRISAIINSDNLSIENIRHYVKKPLELDEFIFNRIRKNNETVRSA